jgi:hypothetical protein
MKYISVYLNRSNAPTKSYRRNYLLNNTETTKKPVCKMYDMLQLVDKISV